MLLELKNLEYERSVESFISPFGTFETKSLESFLSNKSIVTLPAPIDTCISGELFKPIEILPFTDLMNAADKLLRLVFVMDRPYQDTDCSVYSYIGIHTW